MYSKVMRLKWKFVSVRLESAKLDAVRNIGLEIVLDEADGTPR
jgi:hypothetical protein